MGFGASDIVSMVSDRLGGSMDDHKPLGMLRSTCRAAMAGRNSPGNQRYSLKTA